MNIQLSEHFNYKKLIRFVFPSVVMMIFTSIYGVIDGLFVSNYVGKTSFAATNLIYPVLMLLGSAGFMIGTGGSAIVSKALGEKKATLAVKYFSMLVYFSAALGAVLTIAGLIFLRPVTIALGAEGEMVEECVIYGRILIISITPFILQNVFQSLFVTAERPHIGLIITVAAGLTNIVLDYIFIVTFGWGVAGAAGATALSQAAGGILPVLYFIRKNGSPLRLTKTKLYYSALLKACTNGISELMTNISLSLVNILYNFQLIRIAGENGIASYGVIMYVNFIFIAIYFGYAIGSAPIISYHYGAGNHFELKSLYRKSLVLTGISGAALTALAIALSSPLSKIFVGYDAELFEMTNRGFRLYALSFTITGFNIFASSFFTALNNGAVSAIISFLRTLVFQTACVAVLPLFWGLDGIWLAIVAAEIFSLIVTVYFFMAKRKQYRYA